MRELKKSKSTRSKSTAGLTLTELAAALGLDKGQISREAKRPGFPVQVIDGERRFDLNQVKAYRAQNVRQRKSPPAPPAAAIGIDGPSTRPSQGADFPAPMAGDDARLFGRMMSGEATALEISDIAMRMAGQRVAKSFAAGTLGTTELDGLKKTLQEFRQAQAAYIELEKCKRGLIPRDQVCAIVGECVSRLVRAMNVFENSIVTEFAIWLVDPGLRECPADERARKVRDFVSRTTADVRRMEADGVEKLILEGDK